MEQYKKKIEELEVQRKERLALADKEYNDTFSPNYRNNGRYSWAVGIINNHFDELIDEEEAKFKLYNLLK